MNRVTIIMYHYVRELPETPYPQIKGLLVSHFREQLDYLKQFYQFVTFEECLAVAQSNNADFPPNAVLLTFDDAYLDHFTNVFPILEEYKIKGCFFPPARPILEHKVLTVNKLHFLLAAIPNTSLLLKEVYCSLDRHRTEHFLESNDFYFSKLAKGSRFDSKEIVFIKRLLQVELEESIRNLILDELFSRHVTSDEATFASELYMSTNQLKQMIQNGMYVGSHGYNHDWLDKLSPERQERDIDLSIRFLKKIGSSTEEWAICYPYGAYNDSLIEILKRKNCKLGFTVKTGLANLNKDNALTLERLDTNDLPKIGAAKAVSWTREVL